MSRSAYCVNRVEVIPPYGLKLWFEDGSIKTYDMSGKLDMLCYLPLKNPGYFRRAYTDGVSVAWSDEIDIAPEELYLNGVPVRD